MRTDSEAHDANGNTLADAQGRSFTWDFENRLTQAVVPGTGTTTFKYDPLGRRIQKAGPLGTTNYLYDGANIAGKVDNTGNVLSRHAQGPGVDQPLAEFRSGTASYYAADGLGSITSLTNASGMTAATYGYDTFGNLSASSGSLTNTFRYTGREFDLETGLYYYRTRHYEPSLARFISEDPIRFLAGVNFYAYTGNSPINRIDPSGLDWIYHQSTGRMNHVDNQTGETTEVCTGYAGHNFGLNNPLAQDIPGGPEDSDGGPLPRGGYTIGPLRDNKTSRGTVLPDSMPLIPDPTNDMLDRAGFLIHGGNMKTKSSSQGCIALPRDCRLAIGDSNDKVLRVEP
jgi:RHS repeat-associated protein